MLLRSASLCALTILLGGCLSQQKHRDYRSTEPVARTKPEVASESEPSAVKASETGNGIEAPVASPVAVPGFDTSNGIGAIFRDPKFQQRFAESYLAETEIEPRVTVVEREQLQTVMQLISAEQTDEAIKVLEGSRSDLASAVFDFTLGNLYFQQEKFPQALPAYEAAVAKFPKFRRAWKNIGLIHVRTSEFSKATKAMTKVIELGGGDALTHGLLGFCYSQIDNQLSAESAYRQAILLDPDTLDWKTGLARSLFKQQRFPEAVALFDGLIAANPDRADLWLTQGEAYARQNQPLKAAENFEMVDRLGGSTAESLTNLGDIYANQSLFDMAVDSYLRGLRKDPEAKLERAIRAAKYLSANGAVSETKLLVEGVTQLRGDRLSPEERKELLRVRARIAVAEGAGEEEAKVLKEIVDLDPLDGDALILLGQHAGRTNDPEQAIFYYERAAGIEAFEADAKVRHAQLLVAQGKYAAALPLLRRAQSIKPRDNIAEYLTQVEKVSQSRQ